jgi:hypothetical protein
VLNLGTGYATGIWDVTRKFRAEKLSGKKVPSAALQTVSFADTCRMKGALSFKSSANLLDEIQTLREDEKDGIDYSQSWLQQTHALSVPCIHPSGTELTDFTSIITRPVEGDKLIIIIPFFSTHEEPSRNMHLLLNIVCNLVRFGAQHPSLQSAISPCGPLTALNLLPSWLKPTLSARARFSPHCPKAIAAAPTTFVLVVMEAILRPASMRKWLR